MEQRGRPINLKAVKKVRELRDKGLSFRDISKIMERDLKSIFRWYNYQVGKNVAKVDNSAIDSLSKKS